ncbi:hypothetical protein M409DRAFT_27462 [Zasmidium cellare ATCC 36951]|uniref:Lysine-specific metallo-endopeptidase domain-containing protein n=1 Tax=Zasmidium cellare ATCC 36951 TaxID=1080233 RepID=A0A6A6C4M5_ZASCE|nr:uncharacterized protein M409DRAFT_27462 [Zasmidium cellare ATCC 36951]KAF2162084.1 hypothetical protein M409DRAFT_27462 [Zasmidium cellare ATCC 36951]
MLCRLLQQTAIVALIHLSTVQAADPSLTDLFTVDDSCDQNVLQGMINDARTLLASGQTAIDDLLTSNTFVKTSTRNYMRNAYNVGFTTKYLRAVGSSYGQQDKDMLNQAKAALSSVQSLLSGQDVNTVAKQSRLGANNAFITCSDTGYKQTTNAQDIDPSLPDGSTVKNTYQTLRDYVFVYPGITDSQGRQRRVINPQSNPKICGNGAIALAQSNPGTIDNEPMIQIILCPRFFDPNFPNTNLNVSPKSGGDYIGAYRFAAGGLIHELLHVAYPGLTFSDRIFYDTKNNDKVITSYGPEDIYSIATRPKNELQPKFGDVTTLNLPDAYRLFCDMCQFPNVKWSMSRN